MSARSSLFIVTTLLYLLNPIFCSEDLWLWQCDSSKEKCTRLSALSTPKDDNLYPSLEVCRLICGQYSALWPRPTGTTTINTELLQFSKEAVNIVLSVQDEDAKKFLQDVRDVFLQTLPETTCQQSTTITISITVNSPSLDFDWTTKEDYTLQTVQSSVNIKASTVFGARHALETLSQLIEVYPNDDGSKCLVTPSQVTISDEPVYPHRGLMIDCARNFVSIDVIKKHINALAASKMNILHWHITDSQSFPLELPSLPNMTSYGAYSKDKIYHYEEIQELIYFAKVRGVRIVIEIDSPAHAGNGWQWGAEAGLGNLAVCVNQQPFRSYCIEAPCGQLNPVNPNLYKVLGDLYKDIVNLLPAGEVFHMGGDEVYIACWNRTDEIIKYLSNTSRSTEVFLDLWAEFHGKALQAYDSVAKAPNTPIILWTSDLTDVNVIEKYLTKDRYVIQTWVPASNNLPSNLLELGYRIIVSTKDAWYLDHGFWGNTDYHHWETVYDNKIPSKDKGTLGGEVCMWGEYVDTGSVISRTWPRAAAVGERLWSDPSSNSNAAQYRFLRHRERLVSRDINADAVVPRWCYQNEGGC